MCSGARRDVAGRSRCGDGSDTGGARVREWRPYVVNNNSRDAHDGPTHHYLTLLSTGHPAKEKCAPVAKSISGPSSPIPIPGLFYARQSGNSTRFEVFKRVVRLASVVLPHADTLEQIFLATNRRKSKKARILAGEEFDFRELLKCYSGFGERNDLANATSVARFAK
jgi:hypothetical protein